MAKLGFSGEAKDFTLVLEEDGTVIDDDETLLELQPKIFLLLCLGEQWCASESPSVVEPLDTAVVPDNGGINAAVHIDHVSQQSVAPSTSEYFTLGCVVADHPRSGMEYNFSHVCVSDDNFQKP